MRQTRIFKEFKWGYVALEVLIITIGILIALQIDSWKESRNRKERELKVLREMRTSLINDIKDLSAAENRCDDIISHLMILESHLYANGKYNDTLQEYASRTIYVHQFNGRASSYENLKFNGIDLITNDSIKIKLVNLYEDTYLRLSESLRYQTSELSSLPYFSRQLMVQYRLEGSHLKSTVWVKPSVFNEKEFLYNVSFKIGEENDLKNRITKIKRRVLGLIEDISKELFRS